MHRVSPPGAKKVRTSWPKMAARRARRGHSSGKHGRPGWLQQQARGLKGYA